MVVASYKNVDIWTSKTGVEHHPVSWSQAFWSHFLNLSNRDINHLPWRIVTATSENKRKAPDTQRQRRISAAVTSKHLYERGSKK